MRESGDGRGTVFPWGDAPSAPAYAVGDVICNNYNPPSFGAVVSVEPAENAMGVKWDDGDSAIIYPMDATYLRKAYPWEL